MNAGELERAQAERRALEDLLQSDGWKLFAAHMATAWGPEEYERKLDALLEAADTRGALSPDEEIALTRRVRDTFKGVRASMRWPEERVRQLVDATKPKEGAFDRFRRTPKAG